MAKFVNKGSFCKNHEYKGNQFEWPLKAKKRKKQNKYNDKVIKRLTKDDFNRITTSTSGYGATFRFTTEVNPDVNVMLLRPRNTGTPDLSQQYLQGSEEENEMRLLNKNHVTQMWNKCIEGHNSNPTSCKNIWLAVSEEEKIGICWKQKLACQNCTYKSKTFKLYQEADRNTRLVSD